MDNDWARTKLEQFLESCEEYDRRSDRISPGQYWDEGLMRSITNSVEDQLPAVQRIIKVLDPSLMTDTFGVSELYSGLRATATATRKALAVLRDQDEWKKKLAPQGPSFVADELHEWVWGAAAQFWQADQFEAAVEYGAKSLTAHIQKKSGMDTADRELASEVFSPKASSKSVRLWLPGPRDTDTWKSRQDGLHLLAMGVLQGSVMSLRIRWHLGGRNRRHWSIWLSCRLWRVGLRRQNL
ncbi:MAG: TIGR02391 family protein [Corynebacterium sp.]|nr:TIGR02391 family protein [Corynebacterium sp.]